MSTLTTAQQIACKHACKTKDKLTAGDYEIDFVVHIKGALSVAKQTIVQARLPYSAIDVMVAMGITPADLDDLYAELSHIDPNDSRKATLRTACNERSGKVPRAGRTTAALVVTNLQQQRRTA